MDTILYPYNHLHYPSLQIKEGFRDIELILIMDYANNTFPKHLELLFRIRIIFYLHR